jgi:hypothetical protein
LRHLLADIRTKLIDGVYLNEEHVRLSLVARVVQQLGWDIWNPREVNTEFRAVPAEDQSRVDMGLFSPPSIACVFIEVKAVGKLHGVLSSVEQQLRDYNRNHTATFSVITDGRTWHFYYSQSPGTFADKRFESADLVDDEPSAVEESLVRFLSKNSVVSGEAREAAEKYLRLSNRQRAMEDHFPEAQRAIVAPPYPSLPNALLNLLRREGFRVTEDEVLAFIDQRGGARAPIDVPPSWQPVAPAPADRPGHFIPPSPSVPRVPSRALPPDGTACRFSYKDTQFRGRVEGGLLVVNGQRHGSFSSASKQLTQTSRNGWKDWELQLPGHNDWLLADTWRRSQ